MHKQFQVADLSEADKVVARKCIEWMQSETRITSSLVRLPFLGQVTINVTGTIYKNVHD